MSLAVALRQPASASAEELAQSPLLADVDLPLAMELLRHCPVRELTAGEALIEPGSTDADVFLVLGGRLCVRLAPFEDDSVCELGPGETVGELSLVDRRERSAWVVALEPTRVLCLASEVFWSLIHSSHEVAINLLNILATRLRGSNSAIQEGRRLSKLYRRHASVDALTGLYNRRWLDEVMPRQVRRSAASGEPLSALMIDVDHFKRFNDQHGHAAGDFVLFAVAQVLRDRLRPTDLVARYGGEEFTALLPKTDSSGARVAAERIRRAVAFTPLVLPDGSELPHVTLSIGISELSPGGEEAAQLLARADRALYSAKRSGRNRVES